MAGPVQQHTRKVIIPPGESRMEYNPASLAYMVQNLEVTQDGTMKSVTGPAILRISTRGYDAEDADITDMLRDASIPSLKNGSYWNTERPHSIFHAPLDSGSASQLIYRFGSRLYRFNGSQAENNADEVLLTGLSDSSLPDFPDQYVVMHNRVVWTNGVDRAQVISANGNVTELGFAEKPSPPDVLGPAQVPFEHAYKFYPNSWGYSWPGKIGTAGDTLAGQAGALLSGIWYYYTQYEDIYGNLSAFSASSAPVALSSNQADPFGLSVSESPVQGTEITDLTRRFIVKTTGDAPSHAVATHIYRTADTLHVDQDPRLLIRVPGSTSFVYDDNNADSELGPKWERTVRVPIFRVACAHQGRLVIGNTTAQPGIVRRSQPGFAGTFLRNDFVFPDSGGAEVTAVADHRGMLLAFTERCVYSLADFANPVPLTQGIGCVAPKSIQATRDGMLIWLGRDGFYGMPEPGVIQRISASIDTVMRRHVNRARMRVASSVIDAETGEYRCVLAPAGSSHNTLMLCFDGKFWRRQRLGVHIADLCSVDDWREYTLAIGTDMETEYAVDSPSLPVPYPVDLSDKMDFSRVFVLGHQTSDYFAPARSVVYRSGWLRFSEEGMLPAHVRSMYIGMLDAWDGDATVRIYRDGSWNPINEMNNVRLVGVDMGSRVVEDIAGKAVVGSSRAHRPRLFWREIPVDIRNATSWAFEIEITGSPSPAAQVELGRMHLAAFAFDTSVATQGQAAGRLPRRSDT